MLVDEIQDGLLLGLKVLEEIVLTLLVPVDDFLVEPDESHQFAVPFHDEGITDSPDLVDDLLDFLRVDVLAGWSEYHIPEPSLYVVTSFRVDRGQVMGPEPAVVRDGLPRPLGILVVPEHHVVSLGDDFSFAGLRINILKSDLDVVCRMSYRAYGSLSDRGCCDQRGCLRESVAYGIREFRLEQEFLHYRVQFRAADSEELEPAAEGLVHFPSHDPVKYAWKMIPHPREDTAFLDCRNHACLVDLFDDERHRAHDRRPDLLHGSYQDGRGRRFLNIVDACSDIERIEHAEGHLIGVGHRQDGKPDILLGGLEGMVGGNDVLAEVPVAEHHSLRLSGSAGGVDDGCQVIGLRVGSMPVTGEGRVVLVDDFEGLDVHHEGHLLPSGFRNFREQAFRHEYGLALRMGQDVGDLVFG